MSLDKVIWAVTDDRAGNQGQVIGLAQALGPYLEKKISYNKFAKLPNFLKFHNLIGVDRQSRASLKEPFPDIAIGAGRKTAPVLLHIKNQYPGCKIIQIMHPNLSIDKFDLILLPSHDNKINKPNVITTLGALHKITPQLLEIEQIKWQDKFANLPRPLISLMVGGNSKNGIFTDYHAAELGDIATKLANKHQGSLLITTSRRTEASAVNTLKKSLNCPYYLYSYGNPDPNPYIGYLAVSDAIIITGDSISMCSEACITGKPVYIYAPSEINGSKHKIFLQELFNKKYANRLTKNSQVIEFKQSPILDEVTRIANQLR